MSTISAVTKVAQVSTFNQSTDSTGGYIVSECRLGKWYTTGICCEYSLEALG